MAMVYGWKGTQYQDVPSEDALFWFNYGYNYYQQWEAQQNSTEIP